jgi:hypothetical protein
MRILANDGIDAAGKVILEAAGFEVITDKIPQNELTSKIAEYDVIIVRSATKVTSEIIDAGNLKLIARAGVGLDNIDMKHAGLKNIPVVNTPNASSRSVAELVFAHLFSVSRFLHLSNREMPQNGIEQFNSLKKIGSSGFELKNKKLGIIGFGRIGQEVAKMAIGLGMEVLVYDYKQREFDLKVSYNTKYQVNNFKVTFKGMTLNEILQNIDKEKVYGNIQKMVDLAIQNGAKPYVLLGYDANKIMTRENLKPTRYSTVDQLLVKKQRYLDYQNNMKEGVKNTNFIDIMDIGSESFDGIHPKTSGQKMIKEII